MRCIVVMMCIVAVAVAFDGLQWIEPPGCNTQLRFGMVHLNDDIVTVHVECYDGGGVLPNVNRYMWFYWNSTSNTTTYVQHLKQEPSLAVWKIEDHFGTTTGFVDGGDTVWILLTPTGTTRLQIRNYYRNGSFFDTPYNFLYLRGTRAYGTLTHGEWASDNSLLADGRDREDQSAVRPYIQPDRTGGDVRPVLTFDAYSETGPATLSETGGNISTGSYPSACGSRFRAGMKNKNNTYYVTCQSFISYNPEPSEDYYVVNRSSAEHHIVDGWLKVPHNHHNSYGENATAVPLNKDIWLRLTHPYADSTANGTQPEGLEAAEFGGTHADQKLDYMNQSGSWATFDAFKLLDRPTTDTAANISTAHTSANISTAHTAANISTTDTAANISTAHMAANISTTDTAANISTTDTTADTTTTHTAAATVTRVQPQSICAPHLEN